MAREANEESRREKERRRLLELKRRQPSSDPTREPGVLLSDVIRDYAERFDLIQPFYEENLKPANYKLTVGDQYAINGEIKQLSDEPGENELLIPPFAVAIIETRETINMPRFLIGRWNIQVRRAYEGLVWVGGPQVDAGYVGHLFCPIYNLSDKDVTLRWGDPIAVIDFVKTTDFREGKSKPYRELPENILFEDYKPDQLISGLVTHVQSRIEGFGTRVDEVRVSITAMQSRTDNFILLTFGAVSVLFAALTIFVTRGELSSWWSPSLFLISGLAIFLSMSAWLRSRVRDRPLGWIVQIIVVVSLAIAIIFHIFWGRTQQREIGDLRQQIKELRITPQSQPSSVVAPNTTGVPTGQGLPDGRKSVSPTPSQNKQ